MLLDVNATKLGRSLLSFAGTLVTDAEIVNSVTDVFGPKSSGTLLKRSNSMWRFSQWLHKLKLGSPFTQPEEIVYRYLQFLKESQAGATSASHFLEALGFFGSLLGFTVINVHEVISVRVKGAAHIQYMGKRVRRPAEVLTVDEVRSLEDLVLDSTDPKTVIIAGHLMFCLMAAPRWWDTQHVVTAVASTYKGVWLVEAETSRHKTSMTKQLQTELLPFTALGRTFQRRAWAERWLEARIRTGFKVGNPFLTSFSDSTGTWTNSRMSTAEATFWLRELLTPTSGIERATTLTVHGLKATLLSWAAKSTMFTPEEQTALGHHMSKAHRSAMIYSRDNQIALAVKVHNMLARIRAGLFHPDYARVERLVELVSQSGKEPESPNDSSSGPDDESDASTIAESGDELRETARMKRADPWDVDHQKCVVHRLSSIIHIMKPPPSDHILGCGRHVSGNLRPSTLEDIQSVKALVCAGCSRYMRGWQEDL